MSVLHQDSLIIAVISKPGEEDTTTEQGYLKGLDVDINSVLVPRPRSDRPREGCREESVEVEKEEYRSVCDLHEQLFSFLSRWIDLHGAADYEESNKGAMTEGQGLVFAPKDRSRIFIPRTLRRFPG